MAESAAYEDTYRRYLARLEAVDFTDLPERLGCEASGRAARVYLLGERYRVGPDGRRSAWPCSGCSSRIVWKPAAPR